jgi:hypothetical protein
MDDGDLHDEILRLEAHIAELTEVIESCRKAILVSKVAIAAGGIWLLAFTLGAIGFDPIAMIGAIPPAMPTEGRFRHCQCSLYVLPSQASQDNNHA